MTQGRAHLLQGDATAMPFADQSVDLIFASPPYADARTYGINAQRNAHEWVKWMLGVIKECVRVCRGLVLINCAGVTRDRCYWPFCEGLLWEWFKLGGQCWRPCFWHRVGIPGSGGKHWLRADVEYVLAFKATAEWPEWSNNTVNGHPPKWGPGGEMSHRLRAGERVNQWGRVGHGRGRNSDGTLKAAGSPSHVIEIVAGKNQWGHSFASGGGHGSIDQHSSGPARPSHMRVTGGTGATGEQLPNRSTPFPVLANPGNLITGIPVGGGLLGSRLAHENEAPFPERLAEWFIKGWCKPGGSVLDPFSGSGTTVSVARRLGRVGVGMDLRFNQCHLGQRRLAEVPKLKRRRSYATKGSD